MPPPARSEPCDFVTSRIQVPNLLISATACRVNSPAENNVRRRSRKWRNRQKQSHMKCSAYVLIFIVIAATAGAPSKEAVGDTLCSAKRVQIQRWRIEPGEASGCYE